MAPASPFIQATLTLSLPLLPSFIGRELEGATSAIGDMLGRYHSELGGVLLAYARPRFATSTATASAAGCGGGPYVASHSGAPLGRIFEELPVIHVRVSVDALVFKPSVGSVMHGRVVSMSPGHLGLLVAGLFNATIHIDDMAGGYTHDEDAKAWIAAAPHAEAVRAAGGSGVDAEEGSKAGKKRRRAEEASAGAGRNRVLAFNPSAISTGTHVAFGATKLVFTQGILQLFGTFRDDFPAAPMPAAPAPGAEEWSSDLLAGFSSAASEGTGGVAPELEAAVAASASAASDEAAAAGDEEVERKARKDKKRSRKGSAEEGAPAAAAPAPADDEEAPASESKPSKKEKKAKKEGKAAKE